MKKLLSIILSAVMALSLVACQANEQPETDIDTQPDLWATAIYTEDAEEGTGGKTVAVIVTAGEKSVTVTLHTDRKNFGDALRESSFVQGTDGEYGLYITHVNGIKAVYEEDNAYWAFLDGEGNYMNYGVDDTELTGNDTYCLIYTLA